jgi:hypothetical protein
MYYVILEYSEIKKMPKEDQRDLLTQYRDLPLKGAEIAKSMGIQFTHYSKICQRLKVPRKQNYKTLVKQREERGDFSWSAGIKDYF